MTQNTAQTNEVEVNKKNKELREKFIVLEIENENFVIPLEYVSEIVRVQDITEAPNQPDWVRGIMNLRESVISLVDTRRRLGVKSSAEQAIQNVIGSKTSHINWLDTLIDSVKNGIPFNLPISSKQGNFGKWAKSLSEQKDTPIAANRKLADIMPLYDILHRRGEEALNIVATGNKDDAIKIVDNLKEELLPRILRELDELEVVFRNIHNKNIAVILEFEGSHFAMLADDITKMKNFTPEERQKGSLTDSPFVLGVFDDEEGLYQELDLRGILKGHRSEIIESNESEEKE